MRILLINPPFTWNEIRAGEGIVPPLGLLYMAGVIEKELNDSLYFLDARAEGLSLNKIKARIKKINPDLIGMGCMTICMHTAIDIARVAKEVNKNVKIILGGPHPSALPKDTLKSKFIDFAVVGEGEETIIGLIKAIKSKKNLSKIKGISYKKNNKIFITPSRELIKDLDSLPFPSRHLLNWKCYKKLVHRTLFSGKLNAKYTTMLSSRGCPYACTYCAKAAFGRMWRARSAENVVNEIESVVNEYNVDEISFHDDLFTLNKKRVVKICDLILKKGIKISWAADARADCVDFEMLKKMKKAGCYSLFYGVESGNQEILNKINKKLTLKQMRDAINITKKTGITTTSSYIIGLPGETKKTVMDTIRFSYLLNTDIAHFNILTPFPGSPLFDQLKKQGKILTYDWSKYNPHGVEDIVFKHENLSNSEIGSLHTKAYKGYYIRAGYVVPRIFKLLKNPKGLIRAGINFSKIILGKGM